MPIFGNQERGSIDSSCSDDVNSSWAYSPAVNGIATSMSIYMDDASGDNVTLALYDASDASLVATTETKDVGSNTAAWYVFNFTTAVYIYNAKSYYCASLSSGPVDFHFKNKASSATRLDQNNVGGSFPSPCNTTSDQWDFSIYCTYVVLKKKPLILNLYLKNKAKITVPRSLY